MFFTAPPALLFTALAGGLFLPLLDFPLIQPPQQNSCQTGAFVIDPDPQGLNVRSGPSSKFKIVKVLPTQQPDAAMLEISAAQQGWVKISEVRKPSQELLFKGPGWVYAPLLATATRPSSQQRVPLYQAPQLNSKVLGLLKAYETVPLLSCQGQWVKVKSTKGAGWLAPENQCPNSVTTCP